MVIKNQLPQPMVKGVYDMVLYMHLLYIVLLLSVWWYLCFKVQTDPPPKSLLIIFSFDGKSNQMQPTVHQSKWY